MLDRLVKFKHEQTVNFLAIVCIIYVTLKILYLASVYSNLNIYFSLSVVLSFD